MALSRERKRKLSKQLQTTRGGYRWDKATQSSMWDPAMTRKESTAQRETLNRLRQQGHRAAVIAKYPEQAAPYVNRPNQGVPTPTITGSLLDIPANLVPSIPPQQWAPGSPEMALPTSVPQTSATPSLSQYNAAQAMAVPTVPDPYSPAMPAYSYPPTYSPMTTYPSYGSLPNPPAPAWLPQFVPSQTAYQPITRMPTPIPSGQMWGTTPWSQREGLRGYMNWAGYMPYQDMLDYMRMMLPAEPPGIRYRRWMPIRQRTSV